MPQAIFDSKNIIFSHLYLFLEQNIKERVRQPNFAKLNPTFSTTQSSQTVSFVSLKEGWTSTGVLIFLLDRMMEYSKSLLIHINKYIILSQNPKQLVMTSNQNSHFGQFMLPFSQPNYNFIQTRAYQSIQTLQTETNPRLKKHNLQSFKGKGKWTFNQQKQYLLFLNRNMQEMKEKSTRKSNKVFLKMSQEVKSRTADQCRSHHQKVLKYHESLQEIIRYYTEDVFSFEKIFGSKGSLPKKQALQKTSAQIQNQDSCNIRVEGRTFKIVLKVQQIADY